MTLPKGVTADVVNAYEGDARTEVIYLVSDSRHYTRVLDRYKVTVRGWQWTGYIWRNGWQEVITRPAKKGFQPEDGLEQMVSVFMEPEA